MTGIVDVGGGSRGIFGAGIFDWCLENGIEFDYLIGVSAGSANIASFLGGQNGRNYTFYTEYSFRSEYIGLKALLKSGSYLNLEYIYGYGLTNADAENPLNYRGMLESGKEMKIVATDARTGEPVYYDMRDMAQDDYGAIKGSSCVPVAARAYKWKGAALYDGGLSDPIPFKKALERGCGKVVLILTRPKEYRRDPDADRRFASIIGIKYPNAGKALRNRANVYNAELEEALEAEREGKLLILAPEDISGMSTLSHDRAAIIRMYEAGRAAATAIPEFIGAGK